MTASPRLRVEDRPNGVRVLTLDNPARRNAVDPEILEALAAALDPAATSHVRALLVRGHGGAFCSGYDLGALPPPTDEGVLPDDRLGQVLSLLEHHPAPSVALVDGPAFGAGCELACTCDFRVASPAALFSMPPARLGIVYAPDGLRKLAAIVGLPRAKRMFLTAMRVDAQRAHAWGLADELSPQDAVEAAAFALCDDLAAGAPLAVSGMKLSFAYLSRAQLSEAQEQELRRLRHRAFSSEDANEGRAAFLEKRRPVFKGR